MYNHNLQSQITPGTKVWLASMGQSGAEVLVGLDARLKKVAGGILKEGVTIPSKVRWEGEAVRIEGPELWVRVEKVSRSNQR